MDLNLILFPLLSGYLYIILSPYTKYINQRLERQRLIFNSAIAGSAIVFITFWLKEATSLVIDIDKIRLIIPAELRDSGWNTLMFTIPTSIVLILLSWIIPQLGSNWAKINFDGTPYVRQAVSQVGDEFDKIFEKCHTDGDLIIVTTNFHKVYVGWVQTITRPHDKDHLRILPLMSGYRTSEEKTFKITTEYTTVYAKYIRDGKVKSLDEMGMDIVIAREQIIFANRFDLEIYKSFSNNSTTVDETT